MSGARLTRRQVVAGAVVAGAGAFLGPAAGAAASGRVWSRRLGTVPAGVTPVLTVPRFALVGAQWASGERVQIKLRARLGGGRWSRWASASVQGHDGDGEPGPPSVRFGEPIWFGPSDQVQLRAAGPVSDVRLHFVAAPGAGGLWASAAALPMAGPVLEAGGGQPPIIARRAWAGDRARASRPPAYGTISLAFVHHTVNPNGYGAAEVPALLLAIFDYHRFVRGFFDIAYNFVIDAYGRIWEARAGGIDEPVIGAQAGGYNAESTGVAMLGTYSDVVPTAPAMSALQRLLAWKLSLHGVPALGRVRVRVNPSDAFYTPFRPGQLVSLHRISGHRDGDLTDCPGNALYGRLPSVRGPVAVLAGQPARLTMGASSVAAAPGSQVVLSGLMRTLDGAPMAGAPVELQHVAPGGATTFAVVTTDPAGGFASSLVVQRNVLVRALHRPAPAAVSDPLPVGVVPQLSLALVSRRPPVVEGSVSPPRASVLIDVYTESGGHRRLLASRRARVRGGRFRARVPLGPRPHRRRRLVVVARVRLGGGTLAGHSPPVTLLR